MLYFGVVATIAVFLTVGMSMAVVLVVRKRRYTVPRILGFGLGLGVILTFLVSLVSPAFFDADSSTSSMRIIEIAGSRQLQTLNISFDAGTAVRIDFRVSLGSYNPEVVSYRVRVSDPEGSVIKSYSNSRYISVDSHVGGGETWDWVHFDTTHDGNYSVEFITPSYRDLPIWVSLVEFRSTPVWVDRAADVVFISGLLMAWSSFIGVVSVALCARRAPRPPPRAEPPP